MIEVKYWVLASLLALISPIIVLVLTQWALGLSKAIKELVCAVNDLRIAIEQVKTWAVETFVECEECESNCKEIKALFAAINPHRGR